MSKEELEKVRQMYKMVRTMHEEGRKLLGNCYWYALRMVW